MDRVERPAPVKLRDSSSPVQADQDLRLGQQRPAGLRQVRAGVARCRNVLGDLQHAVVTREDAAAAWLRYLVRRRLCVPRNMTSIGRGAAGSKRSSDFEYPGLISRAADPQSMHGHHRALVEDEHGAGSPEQARCAHSRRPTAVAPRTGRSCAGESRRPAAPARPSIGDVRPRDPAERRRGSGAAPGNPPRCREEGTACNSSSYPSVAASSRSG